MKLVTHKVKKDIKSVRMGLLEPGQCFHYVSETFEEAIENQTIYMVEQGGKDERVNIVDLSCGIPMKRDRDRLVCRVELSLLVEEEVSTNVFE